jgi:hypothetical protein
MKDREQFRREFGPAADYWLAALDEQVRLDPESGWQMLEATPWVRWLKRPFDLPQNRRLVCRVCYHYTYSKVQWLKFTWNTVDF